MFAGARTENETDEATATWIDGEIEWSDAPPLVGEGGQDEGATTTATAEAAATVLPHWFPTAEDGATPGAPAVHVHGRGNSAPCVAAAAGAAGNAAASMERRRDGCAFACVCGAVRAVSRVRVAQLQHCHCALCRAIHGSPFVTWAPLPEAAVLWEGSEGALRAAPTSRGALRHGCDTRGRILAIKYHPQPDAVWLAAGAAAPGDVAPLGEGTRRVLHVCCSWRSAWWPATGEEQRTGIPCAGG